MKSSFSLNCQPTELLVDDYYSYTVGMCFLCVAGHVHSKKV